MKYGRHTLALLPLALAACQTPEVTTVPDSAPWRATVPDPLPPAPTPEPTPAPADDKPFVVVHYGDSHSSVPAMPAELRGPHRPGRADLPWIRRPEHGMPEARVKAVGPWTRHNWIYGNQKGPFGPLGKAWSVRRAEARMVLSLSREKPPAKGVKVTALYAKRPDHAPFELRAGGERLIKVEPPDEGAEPLRLGAAEVELPEGGTGLELKVIGGGSQGAGLRFYGFLVQYPDAKVEYDAFGVIGATIRSPARRFDQSARDYLTLRDPGAIVVWYGSNSAYRKNLDMAQYKAQYQQMLGDLRRDAPNAVCVAVGPPDLGRTGGACKAGGRFALPGSYAPPDQKRRTTAPSKRPGQKVDTQGRTLRRRPGARKRRPARPRKGPHPDPPHERGRQAQRSL